MAISCSEPRYRSVVWIEECPSRNLICSRSPPFLRQSLAQVRRRSWAPKRSMPICLPDRSTTDQIDQSVRVSPLTLPPLRGYQEGADVQALLPTLSVYLEHVRPQDSYWYLTATPELLGSAAERFRLYATSGGTQ